MFIWRHLPHRIPSGVIVPDVFRRQWPHFKSGDRHIGHQRRPGVSASAMPAVVTWHCLQK
ncbi:MAG: hypothetical protein HYW81_00400 [Parcubacteria group bacterium]|nr:hypothetical protein [Parcubacteria group bacterium]